MTSGNHDNPSTPVQPPQAATPALGTAHHNFEAQKEIHQQIRNDPDYDDWEYGTEPLPHEAWVARQQAAQGGGAAS
jgi:hypothetical protein